MLLVYINYFTFSKSINYFLFCLSIKVLSSVILVYSWILLNYFTTHYLTHISVLMLRRISFTNIIFCVYYCFRKSKVRVRYPGECLTKLAGLLATKASSKARSLELCSEAPDFYDSILKNIMLPIFSKYVTENYL